MNTDNRFSPLLPVLAALLLTTASAHTQTAAAATLGTGGNEPRSDNRVGSEGWAAELRNEIRDSVHRSLEAAHVDVQVERHLAQIDLGDALNDAAALAFIGSELGDTRTIVKNAPYSAEAVTELVQQLPDGNRIVRRATTLLARDGYGRTRQERRREHGSTVYIYDPIEGKSFALNGERKTAVRIPRVPRLPTPPTPPTLPTPPTPPTPATPPMAAGAPGAPSTGARASLDVEPGRVTIRKHRDGASPDEVEVEVVRIGRGDGSLGGHEMPGPAPFTFPLLPHGKGETKKLGTREFDGVKADGAQTTQTIPAGAIGNEKPIVVATERWFSPELNVVVYAKTTDPRAGETTYRLTNIRRGEPPAEWFRLPDDYRVRGSGERAGR